MKAVIGHKALTLTILYFIWETTNEVSHRTLLYRQ